MSLTELVPAIRALPHADKLRLMQVLVIEIAREEDVPLLSPNMDYPIWSPYNAYEAAATLLNAIENDKAVAA
jgi:hypothetical protein